MSNIVAFGNKPVVKSTPAAPAVQTRPVWFHGIKPDRSSEKFMKYKAVDYRTLWRDFPEIGDDLRLDKEDILDLELPVSMLAGAAMFAQHIKLDTAAHDELMELFHKLKSAGFIKTMVRALPDHLIGYAVNLVECDKGWHEKTQRMDEFDPNGIWLYISPYLGAAPRSAWWSISTDLRESREMRRMYWEMENPGGPGL